MSRRHTIATHPRTDGEGECEAMGARMRTSDGCGIEEQIKRYLSGERTRELYVLMTTNQPGIMEE